MGDDELMVAYHDREWGTPSRDDRHLYEKLVLEGAQCGLSWRTILHRREGYRRAFAGFDPARVARFTSARVERLLEDPGIIRNRAKIESAIHNARRVLEVRREFGSLARYLWSFVGHRPIQRRRRSRRQIPTESREARAMARDLKRRGFTFLGPTTCYAFLQSCGFVNDHLVTCFRHAELTDAAG